ncbi:MAG: hypothetical protein BWX66_01729 [Deltaproteobacteria bacterium ADurb.Bin058]|nr:MAG: hypothetical protein BWX66_01729 [Deltaproteobacteria bacterium ADurb.Bin058]
MHAPQLTGRDVVNPLPHIEIPGLFSQTRPKIPGQQIQHVMADPTSRMNTISYRSYGDLVYRQRRPNVSPHLLGDLTMQLADAIGKSSGTQSQRSHSKTVFIAHSRHLQVIVKRQPNFGKQRHGVAPHQSWVKHLITSRHRGVRGKNVGCIDMLTGSRQVALEVLNRHAKALQAQKGGVSFIHVINCRSQPQSTQGPNAADAKDNLLPDAHFTVAPVQGRSDIAKMHRVFINICVQQVKWRTPNLNTPNLGKNCCVFKLYWHYD